MNAKHVLQLGYRRDRTNQPFFLEPAARFQHAFLIGQTGTGKSTLLKTMALHDIYSGNGVTFIDPHGTGIDELKDYIPSFRTRDVIEIDPTDTNTVVSINPLIDVPEPLQPLAAENFVQYMRYLWGDSWGPQLENILRHTALAILSLPRSECPSIAIIPLLLSPKQDAYRKHVARHIKDPAVRRFFTDDFGKWPERQMIERTQSVLNKVQQLITTPAINIPLTTTTNTTPLRDAIKNKSIILARLPKGQIGDHAMKILGSVITSTLQQTAMQQDPDDSPTPHYLFMDEAKNFITPASADGLSELRKYRLSITAAAQYCKQLPAEVLDAIFGNVGTFISFRVIDDDARRIAEALSDYREIAYTELGRGEVVVRTLYDDPVHGEQVHGPFPARVDPTPYPWTGQRANITKRQRHISPMTHDEAENQLANWYTNTAQSMPRSKPKAKAVPKKTRRKVRQPKQQIVGSGAKQEATYNPDSNTVVTRRFD